MPTGSLCAERNAIGNALASDPTVGRRDIRAVAVLSVKIDPADESGDETSMNPLDPCGACMEWLRKIGEANPDFKVVTFSDNSCQKVLVTPIDYWQ